MYLEQLDELKVSKLSVINYILERKHYLIKFIMFISYNFTNKLNDLEFKMDFLLIHTNNNNFNKN